MRILFYSPDSYGLGHVRRTIALAEGMLRRFPRASALVLTGAPRAHLFQYPERCDYVKLPSVTKDDTGRYVSRDIELPLDEIVAMRGNFVRQAARSFRPDVMVVDHAPAGLCGEVVPTLDELGLHGTLRVLGLRDVIDEPQAVRVAWERERIPELLERCYDLVLVYGQRAVFDPVAAYRIPQAVARRVEFTGYVGRSGSTAHPADLRARHAPRTGRLVVVTVGGGGDGNVLLRAMLEGYRNLQPRPPFELLAVTGPLMSPRKRHRFISAAGELAGLTVREHVDDVPGLYRAADFVVSMGGYNSVCELASKGARAVIVPRTRPRREQLVRARALEARGVVACLEPERATAAGLMEAVLAGIDTPRPPRHWGLDLGGADSAARAIASRLGTVRWQEASA